MIRRLFLAGAVASAAIALAAPSAGAGEVLAERVDVAPGTYVDVNVEYRESDLHPDGTYVHSEVLGMPGPGFTVYAGGEDEHVLCVGAPDYGVPVACFIPI